MNGIILNKEQQIAADAAVNWFHHSSEQTFSIEGPAGTGKSVVISEILSRLNLRPEEVLPMAYTGQACTIMRKRGMPKACTCHSGLFDPIQTTVKDSHGRIVMNKQFNVPLVKWSFIPKDFTNSEIKLIILDEAWMIPKHFKQHIDNTGIKVLATGDPGQLPPIGGEPGYLTSGIIYHLTELMRQAENSPIVYLANRARLGLPIETGMYGNDVLVIFDDELDNDIIAKSNVVLCGKNVTREHINQVVRNQILGITTDYPLFGERVICRKNNWEREVDGIHLVNGLTGTVISPPDIGRFSGTTMMIDFLPDLLDKPFLNTEINYKYINASHQEKEALKTNPYLEGERFEYAYGSTVHLSQGSEYDSGTYIEEFLRSDIQNALNYTAITRFKRQMIYVKHRPKYWSF